MEHLQHFGLNQDPFQNEPDLRYYFDSASHRAAQLRVERGLRQAKGLTVLTGDSGSGKTLVTRRIFDALEEEIFEVSLMVMLPGAADANSVLSRYARQLGVEEAATDRSELLGQLYEQLAIIREDGRHSLLIVDDAHVMDAEAMAEVGGLLNLEYEDRRLLSMLWVGSPELDVMLANDSGIGQRVEARAGLVPLDLKNSTAYVWHRIETAGGATDLVPEEAMAALFKLGRGRPRLINTLADNGLFEAYLSGRKELAVEDVERAAAELGIGSDPGSTYSGLPQPSSFGDEPSLVMGHLTDPDAGPALDLGAAASQQPGSGPMNTPTDLNGLFETDADPGASLTSMLASNSEAVSATLDLDESVAELLDAQESDVVEDEEDSPATIVDLDAMVDPVGDIEPEFASDELEFEDIAEAVEDGDATRIAFADEIAAAEPAAGSDDEIDDLFVELIED